MGRVHPICCHHRMCLCGFLAAEAFIVMDIGGHKFISVQSARGPAPADPKPLQALSVGRRPWMPPPRWLSDNANFVKAAMG